MGKICLISYGDYDYDGRLRRLVSVFSQLGELHCIMRGTLNPNVEHVYCNKSYVHFVREAVKFAVSLNEIDYLVLDNRKAAVPGLIISQKIRVGKIVQDCRELYIPEEVKHITGKIGCFFEKKAISIADVVICANNARAELMQDIFKLEEKPIAYENLRALEYSSNKRRCAAQKKLSGYIKPDEYRIISTSGCSISRTNDILVSNIEKIHKKCRFFFVGDSTPRDEESIRKIAKEKHLDNVEIIGRLNQDELKFLIHNSHIGIVNYHQNDTNNKYCASGKLFEFIYEGIPVVTTTNPPLRQLCEEEKIGFSDDQYYNGINAILDNYETYKHNVEQFSAEHTVEKNDDMLKKILKSRLHI